jgi:hypothetical protein
LVDEIRGQRNRRFVVIGIVVAVCVAGNAADFLGFVPWGKGLNDPNDRYWVLASAAGFWVAASMFILCFRDLLSILKHRSRPPTLDDLEGAQAMAASLGSAGKSRAPLATRVQAGATTATRWVEKHAALVGLIGFVAGAIAGHLLWRVGTY